MTETAQKPKSTSTVPADFLTSEELRSVLHRFHTQGGDTWRQDPVAAELMEYIRGKYAGLAVKHGLDPWEAASAAFDVMRTKAVRDARDPWAVITHAVRITCIYEERAQGLLCSVHQARRPHISAFDDPERFSDRAFPLVDDHPVFATTNIDPDPQDTTTPVDVAIEDTIELLALLGWPADTARCGVEHICAALTRVGSRSSTFEALRHDKHARALVDVPSARWHALLRALLGNPDPAYAATRLGRGVLLRLLIGETLPVLLEDDALVSAIALPAHGVGR